MGLCNSRRWRGLDLEGNGIPNDSTVTNKTTESDEKCNELQSTPARRLSLKGRRSSYTPEMSSSIQPSSDDLISVNFSPASRSRRGSQVSVLASLDDSMWASADIARACGVSRMKRKSIISVPGPLNDRQAAWRNSCFVDNVSHSTRNIHQMSRQNSTGGESCRRSSVDSIQRVKVRSRQGQWDSNILGESGSDENHQSDPGMVAKYLKKVPYLTRLTAPTRLQMAKMMENKMFYKGDILFEKGDAGDDFYIVLKGKALVSINNEETGQRERSTLREGDYFGEMVLLNKNIKRVATVKATSDLIVLSISGSTFRKTFKRGKSRKKRQAISGDTTAQMANDTDTETHDTDKSEKQALVIKDGVRSNVLFSQLSDTQMSAIVVAMWKKEIGMGCKLIKQGDPGDNFYVVEHGEFDIFVRKGDAEAKVATCGPGTSFGELALMYNSPRAATVIATINSTVWAVGRSKFRQILKNSVAASGDKTAVVAHFLSNVTLFDQLGARERNKIANIAKEHCYEKGSVIIRQGDAGGTFYVIRRGTAKVLKRMTPDGEEAVVAHLKAGHFFGERALLTGEPRAATVIATSLSLDLLTLDRMAFEKYLRTLRDAMDVYMVENYDSSAANSKGSKRPSQDKLVARRGSVIPPYREKIPKERLNILGTLGKGSFGHVRLVVDKKNPSEAYALKEVSKAHICSLGQQEHIMSEKHVMNDMNHHLLINLINTYNEPDTLHFLLEVALGGELFTFLRQQSCFDEDTARFYSGCVTLAFEYMHRKDIIYRDLKPENLLLDQHGYLKVTDFGFAKHLDATGRAWTLCGTPDYLAPEVVAGIGHGKGVDWWCLGILIFEMLASYPPYFDDDPMRTYAKILQNKVSWPRHFSKSAHKLVKGFLSSKPTKRLGVIKGGTKRIKEHPWYFGFDWKALNHRTMKPPIVPNIKSVTDTSNFESYGDESDGEAEKYVDDGSGWDADF